MPILHSFKGNKLEYKDEDAIEIKMMGTGMDKESLEHNLYENDITLIICHNFSLTSNSPIEPKDSGNYRMNVVKPLTIHTPPSPQVAYFHRNGFMQPFVRELTYGIKCREFFIKNKNLVFTERRRHHDLHVTPSLRHLYGYIRNHKKTVKNGQAQTRELEEFKKKPKIQSRSQKSQASVKSSQSQSKMVPYTAEYNVFAIDTQHYEQPECIINTRVVEKVDSNVIPDSPDMCDNDIQTNQNAEDELVMLAN
ncbi:hypothetical protein Tco_0736433 [Tanacetum coccineum]